MTSSKFGAQRTNQHSLALTRQIQTHRLEPPSSRLVGNLFEHVLRLIRDDCSARSSIRSKEGSHPAFATLRSPEAKATSSATLPHRPPQTFPSHYINSMSVEKIATETREEDKLDQWPKNADGSNWDGAGLLPLLEREKSPFGDALNVQSLLSELEYSLGGAINDIPVVTFGANHFVRMATVRPQPPC